MSDVVHFSSAPEVFAKANALFEEVAAELRALLPYADIQHVGSTAVPGSCTKGDLDIVVRVERERFAVAEQVLAARFEPNTGSTGSEVFAAFLDSSTDPDLGVQLVVVGTNDDNDFVKWREQLRCDPVLRAKYDELKQRFEGKSMDRYREEKSEFIAKHLARTD